MEEKYWYTDIEELKCEQNLDKDLIGVSKAWSRFPYHKYFAVFCKNYSLIQRIKEIKTNG